jgi:hypothetical protein
LTTCADECLASIIDKLSKAGVLGFEKSIKLLSLAHFLDGDGDSYEYFCRLAKSHGTKVILFLDGDKRKRVEQSQVAEKHSDVEIILLPGREEFDDTEDFIKKEVKRIKLGKWSAATHRIHVHVSLRPS